MNLPSGEDHRLRYIEPWKWEDVNKAITDPKSNLRLPDFDKHPKLAPYIREITGGVPRVLRSIKDAHDKMYKAHPEEKADKLIRKAIEIVENETMRRNSDELERTFQNLSQTKKNEFVDYLGHVLLPAWYHGLPKKRDGKLYDKGFIYHDSQESVLRVVNEPARRTLLNLFVSETKPENTVLVILLTPHIIANIFFY